MNNLQRHIRGLSRARFVLADAVSSDLFDDTASSSDDDVTPISTPKTHPLPTPLPERTLHDLDSDESDKESSSHSEDEHAASDSDSDGVAPLPAQSSLSLHHSFSSLSRRSSRHIRSSVGAHSPSTPLSSLLEKQLSITGSFDANNGLNPLKSMGGDCDSEDYLDAVDSQDSDDCEVNDSHSLLSANGSRDSQYEGSGSDEEDLESKCSKFSSHCSNPSNDSSRKSEDEMPELQYDEELEALRRELNAFKRRNRTSSRMRRTKLCAIRFVRLGASPR